MVACAQVCAQVMPVPSLCPGNACDGTVPSFSVPSAVPRSTPRSVPRFFYSEVCARIRSISSNFMVLFLLLMAGDRLCPVQGAGASLPVVPLARSGQRRKGRQTRSRRTSHLLCCYPNKRPLCCRHRIYDESGRR